MDTERGSRSRLAPAHRIADQPSPWRGPLTTRQHEGVAVRVLELGERAPRLLFRRALELHPFGGHPAVGVVDIVAPERAVEEGADAFLVTLGREQHDGRLGARDGELDPALTVSHR